MKKKLLTVLFALAIVFAGVFVSHSAYADGYFPWNVDVTVKYDGVSCSYNLRDYIESYANESEQRGFYLGQRAKRKLCNSLIDSGLPENAVYEYMLPNFSRVTECFKDVCRTKADAAVTFDNKGFTYVEGRDGVSIDCGRLFDEMIKSNGRAKTIELPLVIDKAVTANELKRNTQVKGSFTTYYPSSGANRCYNIARAINSIGGITIQTGETFSFNNVVGARTEENGYKQAKVIMDGLYADGVGGGVCQVSTTLYNALLLANFIPKASQHSLVSSYVTAGFDAMVSYGVADLTFVNDTSHPVYIQGVTRGKSVTFTVYGEPNKYRIERESVETRDKFQTVEIVDKVKYPELIYVDQTKIITSGSDGVKTKSYLKYYIGDTLVDTKLIRTNSYKRVDCVVARGDLPRPNDESDK